jgi:DNA-binding CsgD family transcriptional regulator
MKTLRFPPGEAVSWLGALQKRMSQARDEEGKYREQTPVDEVLEVLETAHEPLTATEIADRLDITSRTALNKLHELTERDPTVIRKEVGASAVIWFIRHGAIHEQAFADFAGRLTDEWGGDRADHPVRQCRAWRGTRGL